MTQDERNMLADLAQKISQTPSPARDAEAEDFIRHNIGNRPDALYLMTQTVLIQNMALQQSQHQIQELQQRMQQPVAAGPTGGSFLRPSAPPPQYGQPQYAQPQYAPASPQYAPQYAPAPSAMSGFLRGAAQTAAGVAAGTLAVQGIESLFSHHEGFGGFGGGSGFLGGGNPGETIIENNYYDDPRGGGNDRFADANDSSTVDIGPQDSDFQSQDTSFDGSAVDDSSYDDSDSGSSDDSNFA